MNKYELALVINAKIEDDARTDAIEKIKALIEKFGSMIRTRRSISAGHSADASNWMK